MPNEFELIRRYFAERTIKRADVITGIGDDAAVLTIPANEKLIVAVDTLVSGVHFSVDAIPYDIGYKALAVNLSDLAAMAAIPRWMTLSLTLPECSEPWLKDFSEGLLALAEEFSIELIGGDTTRGPLTVTVQLMGVQSQDKPSLLRSGARPGDLIYVTGFLGDAGLGLLVSQGKLAADKIFEAALERLHRPRARVEFGQTLSGLATSGIDISDGFLADLGHILEANHVGARLYFDAIPLSSAYQYLKKEGLIHQLETRVVEPDYAPCLQFALSAGDDYELCFTIPPNKKEQLTLMASSTSCMITQVGLIEEGEAITGVDALGHEIPLMKSGYQHF
ncbi:Thiamine-monophosphate kinase [hydrothermal vent metagenome]|uniref:Thiamine-monophosphate kinase n=1 Tax=hydrothermal vent metagenome TaxID=652676 RepID=A0A3B0ZKW1_9ZZZZ